MKQNHRTIIEGPSIVPGARATTRGRRRLLSLIALLLTTVSGSAQQDEAPTPEVVADTLSHADSLALADSVQPELRVGVFGGPVSTTAQVKNVDLGPDPRYGIHAGFRAEMEFGYPIYFLVEFEYAQKGIRSNFPLSPGIDLEEEFNFDYLDIPILYRLGLPIGGRFSLSAGFGAHISLLLSRTRISRIAEIDSTSPIRKGLKKYDFGLEGRIGTEIALAPKWSMTADLRYLHGLQNILILSEDIIDDNRSWKGRSLFFSAGVVYQLQRSIRIKEPEVPEPLN